MFFNSVSLNLKHSVSYDYGKKDFTEKEKAFKLYLLLTTDFPEDCEYKFRNNFRAFERNLRKDIRSICNNSIF